MKKHAVHKSANRQYAFEWVDLCEREAQGLSKHILYFRRTHGLNSGSLAWPNEVAKRNLFFFRLSSFTRLHNEQMS